MAGVFILGMIVGSIFITIIFAIICLLVIGDE